MPYSQFLTPRTLNLLILIGCSTLVLSAIFIEPFKSMDPCPMCMMQRAVFITIVIIALLAVVQNANAWGQKVYAVLLAIVAITGASIAGRQIWLQHLPEDKVPACGPGLEYMLEVFPLLEAIQMAITGTGDCAKVQWVFMGLSIPGWSLIAFVGIALISLFILCSKTKTG